MGLGFPPQGVHLEETFPVLSAKDLLVSPFDSHPTDEVAAQIVAVLRIEELLVGDFSDVSEQVGRHESERITAKRLRFDLDAGKLVSMLRDECDRLDVDVSLEPNREEGDLALSLDLLLEEGRVYSEDRPEGGQGRVDVRGVPGICLVERIERDRKGRNAVREQAALPVPDLSSRGGQHLHANPVPLRKLTVPLSLEYL